MTQAMNREAIDDDLVAIKPYEQEPWLRQLGIAAQANNAPLIALLLVDHVKHPFIGDINGAWKEAFNNVRSTLHLAVDSNALAVVKLLVKHPGIDLDAPTAMVTKMPALFHAAMRADPQHAPMDLIEVLIDAGANARLIVEPFRGQPQTLADMAIAYAGHHAGPILEVLHQRDLLATDPGQRAQWLINALATSVMTVDSPTNAVHWLLEHDAPVTGMDAHGRGVAELSQKFKDSAPLTFSRLERALLLEQASVVSWNPSPSIPRSRL